MKVLFICLGNICRSPSAEGILRHKLKQVGLGDKVTIDSAGIGDWHAGEAPDKRAQTVAKSRGYDISLLKARQIKPEDFFRFDIILGMDHNNLIALRQMPQGSAVVDLFLNYTDQRSENVPDPYYGETEDFMKMLDLLEQGCDAIVKRLQDQL